VKKKAAAAAASEGERQRGVAVERKKVLHQRSHFIASETILQEGESRESCGSGIDGLQWQ
jgi:hypothetical protein